MTTRTITVHDRCTGEGCNRVLHSIAEGERGLCTWCWLRQMPIDTKRSINRLIASAFNGSTTAQKDEAVTDAFAHVRRDAHQEAVEVGPG